MPGPVLWSVLGFAASLNHLYSAATYPNFVSRFHFFSYALVGDFVGCNFHLPLAPFL